MSGHSLFGIRSLELVQSLHAAAVSSSLRKRSIYLVIACGLLTVLPSGSAQASLRADAANGIAALPQFADLPKLIAPSTNAPRFSVAKQDAQSLPHPVQVAQGYGQRQNRGLFGALFPFLGKPKQPQYRQPQNRQPQYQRAQPQNRQPSQFSMPRYGKQRPSIQPTMVPLDSWRRYQALQPRQPETNSSDYQSSPSLGRGYRTMCVRLCDGYYWPISFSSSRARMGRDRDACESSCGSPAKLFYYSNSGPISQMRDLSGNPYSKLKTAFKYRKSFDAACRCKADPWSSVELIRHQEYALQARQLEVQKSALLSDGDDYAEKTMPQDDDEVVSVLTDDRVARDANVDAAADGADQSGSGNAAANAAATVTPSFDTGQHRNQSPVFGMQRSLSPAQASYSQMPYRQSGQQFGQQPGQTQLAPLGASPAPSRSAMPGGAPTKKAWSMWKNPNEFQR